MPPDDSVQAALEQLRLLIDRHFGFAGPLREVVLRLEGGREIPLPVPGLGGPAAPLTPTEAAIVAAMRGRPPAKATVVAARANTAYNPHFRTVFKGLQRRGLVEPDPENPHLYRLCQGA